MTMGHQQHRWRLQCNSNTPEKLWSCEGALGMDKAWWLHQVRTSYHMKPNSELEILNLKFGDYQVVRCRFTLSYLGLSCEKGQPRTCFCTNAPFSSRHCLVIGWFSLIDDTLRDGIKPPTSTHLMMLSDLVYSSDSVTAHQNIYLLGSLRTSVRDTLKLPCKLLLGTACFRCHTHCSSRCFSSCEHLVGHNVSFHQWQQYQWFSSHISRELPAGSWQTFDLSWPKRRTMGFRFPAASGTTVHNPTT